MTRQDAAREALAAHDALGATDATEPPSGADGLPLDSAAWMNWHNGIRKPAYERWSLAMDALADELGDPTMSRHPFNFRPVCEAIIGEEA